MTAGAQVRRMAAANQSFVTRVWRWIRLTFWQVVFAQNEWQRLCGTTSDHVDEKERIVQFRTNLALSTSLVKTCNVVFDEEPFPVDSTLQDMASRVNLDLKNVILMSNIRSCLHRCNYVNAVYAQLNKLKDESYNSANVKHEEMLEELWSTLKPNVRRLGGRITKEWGEIGFQGTDPMSDFRGMGILSLIQLIHFASKYPVEAQRALAESNHPTRWYPFSVTGINVTGFLIELMRERLIDIKLYEHADVTRQNHPDTVEQGVLALNEFYSTIFTRFNKLWVVTNPRDVMAFPTVFQALKDSIRKELMSKSFKY